MLAERSGGRGGGGRLLSIQRVSESATSEWLPPCLPACPPACLSSRRHRTAHTARIPLLPLRLLNAFAFTWGENKKEVTFKKGLRYSRDLGGGARGGGGRGGGEVGRRGVAFPEFRTSVTKVGELYDRNPHLI